MNNTNPENQTFHSPQGRLQLYYRWAREQIAQGKLDITHEYTLEERRTMFADWLRMLITQKVLLPQQRLPPYRELVKIPFNLQEQDVAQVIRQLRTEKVLPPRKTRMDAGIAQWTPRDDYCLGFIGEMRATRFDQARRLLARESDFTIESGRLSISRTSEIVSRWAKEKMVVYRQVYHGEPGWMYLTHKGLRFVGLEYRSEPPSSRLLNHLYWITEVRLKLEEELNENQMDWISERSIQAEQEKREKGRRLQHIPDGILVLKQASGEEVRIDIEVQVSKPSLAEVQAVMSDQFWSKGANNPLRYYVNHLSQGVVRSVYRYMTREQRAMRPQIEIIDLRAWLQVE